jgi:NAD(P)-dependent dehydrogenase (short-subunit alcohol dehydrogenase family)
MEEFNDTVSPMNYGDDMNEASKTVLVTGTSTGIGMETASFFHKQGWQVIATMRHPEKRHTPLHDRGLKDLVHLDVMDQRSIRTAIKYTLDKYGGIDVLVNNAGYALYGPFETSSREQLARQFDTNVFGLMEVTREILPLFRKQHGGVLINVASMGGRIGFPLYSLYNASKWAVEGFTESLQYEMKPLNIRVRLIEPGVIKTDFFDRSLDVADVSAIPDTYSGIIKRSESRIGEHAAKSGTHALVVARTIFKAATDTGWRLRYPVGADAWLVSAIRRLLPEGLFYKVLEKNVLD